MASKISVVASAVVLGTTLMVPAAGGMADQPTSQKLVNVENRVPLPVSRPDWSTRMIFARGAAGQAGDQAGGGGDRVMLVGSGAASETPTRAKSTSESSGMKSGSSQALALQLEGAKVISFDGDVVGNVEKVIDQPVGGPQAVVGLGGFLGIGESYVLMPVDSLTPSGKGVVRTELTETQLKSLPAYESK
ncbi:PRC-barrel domain-containing protein [Thalassobaculum sp.]|uniref:PRC-barrel domain-containing protein n=1 Tax=Thalassobaculum sp. TaxID=2022740 RepID=UPI0032EF0469